MTREDTTAPRQPMLGLDRRWYSTKALADTFIANVEAAGYTAMYEYSRYAKYRPHKVTYWRHIERNK